MGKGSEPTAMGKQYDLRYVSRLTPEEIRARLAEKTVPFHPRKLRKFPLLLKELENGDFYLISSGYHHYTEACGIALLHLEPRPGCGDTVLYGTWEKKIRKKRKPRDFFLAPLLLGAIVVLHQLFAMDIHETLRSCLFGILGYATVLLIVCLASPEYRVEERKNLQAFLEENLLD